MRDDRRDRTRVEARLAASAMIEQFHERVIDRLARDRLNQEDIRTTDTIVVARVDLAIGELLKMDISQFNAERICNLAS